MSTRRLIVTALLCGIAILIAGTIMLLRSPTPAEVDQFDPPTSTMLRQP